MAARPAAGAPVHVFIRCWNRPSHLWASLDSLYRNTTTPCRFVLIDNASDDPEALRVIEGFARRGMFGAVHRMPRNDPGNQQEVYALHRAALGPFLVLADADVIVDAATPDWLDRMLRVMRARPRLGLLGAAIDPSDFVSMERARALAPEAPDAVLERLVKANSAERRQPPLDSRAEIINPYPPAGRLLLARTEALDRTGALIGARRLCAAVEAEGFEVGITPQVVHRHLSLLNLFDYPDYDFAQLHRYLGGR
ncbi:MAG: glycosyltransferase family A protein [Sphingomonas sp.]